MVTFLDFLSEEIQYFLEAAPAGAQLFNAGTGIPEALQAGPPAGLRLQYNQHAREAIVFDEKLTKIPQVVPGIFTLIEVEAVRGRPTKWVIRVPIDETPRTSKLQPGVVRDLALVIQADGIVRTGWTNARNDVHRTLDRSKYTRPQDFRTA